MDLYLHGPLPSTALSPQRPSVFSKALFFLQNSFLSTVLCPPCNYVPSTALSSLYISLSPSRPLSPLPVCPLYPLYPLYPGMSVNDRIPVKTYLTYGVGGG
jgi:hypothetical protein